VITRIITGLPPMRVLARTRVAALLSLFWLAAACGGGIPEPTASLPKPTQVQPSETPTPFQPSPTPQALAAVVNGESITLEQYNAELARYQAVVGTQLATGDQQRVLDDLINRLLLAQAAAEAGYMVDETAVQERIDELVSRLDNEQSLMDWMASQGYTDESFRLDLASSMAAAWMRDRIVAEVPTQADQVHARQILLANSTEAASVLARIQAGEDFATLVVEYDPVARGDLGWFPRGYLLDTRLEDAAFQLQAGEISPVVETDAGFHILQVIERDPAHPLASDARLSLQTKALKEWLRVRRSESDIQILSH
jgi:peptidyl-prolyl cis-trans isomerase C